MNSFNGSGMSSSLSLADAIADTCVQQAEHFESIGSTNDRALQIVGQLTPESLPFLIVADRQTAGRGRGRNRWFAREGVLTFTLIVDPARWNIPQRHWPGLSVAVGGAVAQALQPWSRVDRPQLKWPNDVLIRHRKVCGILIESSAQSPGRLVIGAGVNVSNSFEDAPADVAARAISLVETSEQPVPHRFDVLKAIVQTLDTDFQLLSNAPAILLDRWRRSCALTGRMVAISELDRLVTGVCEGLEDDGSLLVRTESGPQRCYAGTVSIID
jgi:BirA family transcriptional regulator, biotin operon repressor / biotin---[acetyl-CoA-carboxylase] ligase